MFDKQTAIQEFGLTEDMWTELFQEFLNQTRDRLLSFDLALAGDDAHAIAELAHGIKGVAGNLRVADMYAAASALEVAAKQGDIAKARARVEDMKALFGRLEALV